MKNFVVNFEVANKIIRASVICDTDSSFSTILNESYFYQDIEDIEKFIKFIKNLLTQKIKFKKYSVEYNLILDDKHFKTQCYINKYEQKVDNKISQTHITNFEQYLSKELDNNSFCLRKKAFMYELINQGVSKKYQTLNFEKQAQNLIIHYSMLFLDSNKELYLAIIALFKKYNITIKNTFSKSTCLNASQKLDKHVALIEFDAEGVKIDGFFNNVNLFSVNRNLPLDTVIKLVSQKLNCSEEQTRAFLDATLTNWSYFNSKKFNSKQGNILKAFENIIQRLCEFVKKAYYEHYSEGQQVIFIIKSPYNDLVKSYINDIKYIKIVDFSENDKSYDALDAIHYGAYNLSSLANKEDQSQTLTNVNEFKSKNIFQKLFNNFKNNDLRK